MKTQLLHLGFAHIVSILCAPAIGAIMLLIQEVESPNQLFHSGALLLLIYSALSTYVFLLIPTALTVIWLSPFLFCLSRIPYKILAASASLLFGAAAGLLFQILFVPESPGEIRNIIRSITISLGAITALALSIAWRNYAVWLPLETPIAERSA